MTDAAVRSTPRLSPTRLAVLIPLLIVGMSVLTLVNRAYYDEALEDVAAQTVHLACDPPRLAWTELWIIPFEGWGQLALMAGQRLLLAVDDSTAAKKLAAIAVQIAVYWLWLAWARRLLAPIALALGSLLFVFSPDNYFGTMVMSHGHHAESLLFLLTAFLLLQRAGRAGWLATAMGALAGLAVAFYPSNLVLAGFAAGAVALARRNPLPGWRRLAWFGAGAVAGYLPLVILLAGAGLPWWSQFAAADDAVYRFGEGVWPLPEPVPVFRLAAPPTAAVWASRLTAKIGRTLASLYIAGGGPFGSHVPTGGVYPRLGSVGLVAALVWWLRQRRTPRFLAGYVAALAAAYLLGGDRFTVALDHPGEPDAFRYLIGLYPLLFAAAGSGAARLLSPWTGTAPGRARWPGGVLAAVFLLMASIPALARCQYAGEWFGQVTALRFGSPLPLGLHYYRHYGAEGLGPALARARDLDERWPGLGPLAAEAAARGVAVAATVEDWHRAAPIPELDPVSPAVVAGWNQGRGYAAAGMAALAPDGGIRLVGSPPAAPVAAGWFWYGVGLRQGHRPPGPTLAGSCPEALAPWYWRGYGEGILIGLNTVNNDFVGGWERLGEVPAPHRLAARAGFLRGVCILAHPDRRWTRNYLRRRGVSDEVAARLVPALGVGEFTLAERILAGD